jgi:alkylhydroperoxidase/carboxymuconolactone decarboxylase family protein
MHYYESKDLSKFSDVGKFRKPLWDKFMEYYSAATGEEGALTKREKALIALAIAHFKQCPYCIDAYTTGCLEAGANPDQMTEAIHVAAAMAAGMALVHGVQMQNTMEREGA